MLLNQVFDLSDIPRVGALTLIELVLSADNAIVLAVLVHSLAPAARKKALYIGLISAFILRALALFFVSFILQSHWLEAVGGAYLICLGLYYFFGKNKKRNMHHKSLSFWKAIVLVEAFDLVFAIDSIIAGIAFIAGPNDGPSHHINPKLWIVYVGGMLGVLTIRYAADLFHRLIERFPYLEKSAHLLVTWIGIKLCLLVFAPHMPGFEILFWTVLVLILFTGFCRKKLH